MSEPITVQLLPGFSARYREGDRVEIWHPKSDYMCLIAPERSLEVQVYILDKLATQAAWTAASADR